MKELLETLPQTGRLEWIGIRPERRAEMLSPAEVEARVGLGLLGDRAAKGKAKPERKRQVTLIQAEHVAALPSLTGLPQVDPSQLRRNLLVSGINLLALKDARFYIGEVLLEGTGLCHPCSRMEETLGMGGYNAMRGHGGITARVLSEGVLRLGDVVRLVLQEPT